MKVISDTNVLISAVLKGRNPRIVVQFVIDNAEWEWIVSPKIVAEYKEVLSRRKFSLTEEIRAEWWKILDTVTTQIDVDFEVDFPRDSKDAKFLACAIAAEADFLITGDRDFSEVQALGNTTIISVSFFKQLVCDVKD
ncbi:MAG: putative toxin-antitoxin system toxin component, PIN family [Desertifilum sp.]|nr:putative toxin-antitoxin system toxin component, PIN family [Desertifilum sp.]